MSYDSYRNYHMSYDSYRNYHMSYDSYRTFREVTYSYGDHCSHTIKHRMFRVYTTHGVAQRTDVREREGSEGGRGAHT